MKCVIRQEGIFFRLVEIGEKGRKGRKGEGFDGQMVLYKRHCNAFQLQGRKTWQAQVWYFLWPSAMPPPLWRIRQVKPAGQILFSLMRKLLKRIKK